MFCRRSLLILSLSAALIALPAAADDTLKRADALLWAKKYEAAASLYRQILAKNPRNGDARLHLAQAEYWSGDYRSALRDFRLVATRPEARRAIAEIEAYARPGYVAGADGIFDDQPYHAIGGTASVFVFSDPLTKWQLDLSDTQRESDGLSATTPFARINVDTAIVPSRLGLRASIARMRFPDSTTGMLPMVAADVKLSSTTLTLTGEREALLRTAGSLRTHPTADSFSARWWRGDNFSVDAQHSRYYDGNSGNGADAWYLQPFSFASIGASVAWRNTAESRFANGVYDPYYTPRQLREARLIASKTIKAGRSTIGIHLDGGSGHEEEVGVFHPWRAAATLSVPLSGGSTFALSVERSATAFYTANEIHASVAGRF